MAQYPPLKNALGESAEVSRVVRAVNAMASQIVAVNFDAEAERIFEAIAREMESLEPRLLYFSGHGVQRRSTLRLRPAFATWELLRQVMANLELKLGRMQSLRKELFGRFRKLFRLIRDVAAGRTSCFLRKRHRRLINQTDFAHDYSLIRLQCALPVFTAPSAAEMAGGPVNSLGCFNEMHFEWLTGRVTG